MFTDAEAIAGTAITVAAARTTVLIIFTVLSEGIFLLLLDRCKMAQLKDCKRSGEPSALLTQATPDE